MKMLRKITFLIIISLLMLSSCKLYDSPIPNSIIFFTFEGKENLEIWKVNRDGTLPENIYEIPRHLIFSLAQKQIITSEVAAELKAKPFKWKGDEKLETWISNIHLSPNQKMFSWLEFVDWCPGNYCVGQSSIKILSLENNVIISSYSTTDQISMASWSPDSRYIMFDQINKWTGDHPLYSINLFNVMSLEKTQLGEGLSPVFAKAQARVLAYKADGYKLSCCQIINLPLETAENIPIYESSYDLIDLSPDGNSLAAISYENNLSYVNIINIQTQQSKKLDMSFENRIYKIKWSPNQEKLALSSPALSSTIPFQFTVVNIASNTELSIEGVTSWDWAENSNDIIFIKQNKKFGCNAIDPSIYFLTISNKEISKMDFPSPIKNYLTDRNIYECLNNLIDEITW